MEKILSVDKKNSLAWFYLFGLIALLVPVFAIVLKVTNGTHGIFMYPYDDTFIHLTIADNLLMGTWGINPDEFASASSSVLYTLILAFFRMFSKSTLVPLIVNCLAGILTVICLHHWLKKQLASYTMQSTTLLLVIFFTPLPLLIVSGMEHTLQCLFSFLFIFYFSDWLEESNSSAKRTLPLRIFVFGLLVTSIRYEGLFLVVIACLLLLIYRKAASAFLLGTLSILPLLIFGMVSIKKGEYFLPNSVLVKSAAFNYNSPIKIIADIFLERLVYARNGMASLATQRLLIIVPLFYLLFRKRLKASYFFILIFLFGATVMQLSFASTGYLYRYEAYLFFCFCLILPLILYKYGHLVLGSLGSLVSKIAMLAVVFFLFFPLVLRSITALQKAPQACINIYDQQYQMAMFAKKYYNENTVALNDIGAVGYFTNASILDLWGLANIDVTKSKKRHYWSPAFLDSLCKAKNVKAAMIYDSWFPITLTNNWYKVATWQIQNNVICGDSVVSFYSLDSSSKQLLQQQLKTFELQLPSSVGVKYY